MELLILSELKFIDSMNLIISVSEVDIFQLVRHLMDWFNNALAFFVSEKREQ